jgi:hypothetical protein
MAPSGNQADRNGGNDGMADATLENINPPFEALRSAVSHPGRIQDALSDAERDAYREAQQSVVDARRKAETHEGLLRVN